MYNQITSNKRKTIFLMAIFIAIILGVGYIFEEIYGYGGMVALAVVFSIFMALFSYYGGDRMALLSSGAKGPIKKEDNAYVYRMVENLAIASGVPMPKIYIINDSAPNAFATGRDYNHASIALTTGIIERLENEELEGVIAHELSHIKNYDIRVMTIVVVLVGIISILTNWFFRINFFGGRDRGNKGSVGILMVIGILAIILSPIVAELIKLAISRKREFLADASGALLTRYPEGLARALEKISAYAEPMKSANSGTAHLFISNPFGKKGYVSKFFSTHPPVEERVNALRKML